MHINGNNKKLSYNCSCKIFYAVLQEKLHFSARLARHVQDLVQDLARFAYFLQDDFTGNGNTANDVRSNCYARARAILIEEPYGAMYA